MNMFKYKYILSLLFALPLLSPQANAQYDPAILQELRVDVIYLASDYMEGRETGQKGELLAAQYIATRFAEVGLTPKGDDGNWLQLFPFKELVNPHVDPDKVPASGTGRNVVGFLDNKAPHTVIIGGHYDHLGFGDGGSLHAGEKAIHNGADDNASGIAALFQLAAFLKDNERAKHSNYLFIAFSGEEKGLFGSKYYADHPTIDLATANYMLNMDMVGRLNAERILAINGAGTSPAWKTALPNINFGGIQIKTTDSGIGPSDHTSFYLKDIPVLHFFTGQHREYHKPGDDSHLVNYEGIYDVAGFMLQLIEKLDPQGKIAFTKTKEPESRKAASFKVTLGVMPDYVYGGEGMRIDAVLADRTAAKGGLEDGDIVLKIGDLEVKDIYSYMEGLSKYKKGDRAKVVVKRGEKMVTKEVVF